MERHTTNDFGYYWTSSGLYAPYDTSFDKDDPSYEALAYGSPDGVYAGVSGSEVASVPYTGEEKAE